MKYPIVSWNHFPGENCSRPLIINEMSPTILKKEQRKKKKKGAIILSPS
jgi:hypothetical protein